MAGLDGGVAALIEAFPNAATHETYVTVARVMVAAGQTTGAGKKAMRRLVGLIDAAGLQRSRRRERAKRVREMIDALEAKHGPLLGQVLLNAFRGLSETSTTLDVSRLVDEAASNAHVLERLARIAKARGVQLDGRVARKLRTGARRAEAYGAAAIDAVSKRGAKLPTAELVQKRSWRVQVVDTPEGSIAKPAFVVCIEPNAPIGRLSRPARPGDKPALEAQHVRAAEEVVKLYFASMKNAKLIGSYDGVVVDGGSAGARAAGLDTACDSWRKLEGALKSLLPIEERVVMEVCVYETPIGSLARARDLVHFTKREKAEGAVVQTLRCGLERLAVRWGLDLGAPQDAST